MFEQVKEKDADSSLKSNVSSSDLARDNIEQIQNLKQQVRDKRSKSLSSGYEEIQSTSTGIQSNNISDSH
jgi:hypothetical protein